MKRHLSVSLPHILLISSIRYHLLYNEVSRFIPLRLKIKSLSSQSAGYNSNEVVVVNLSSGLIASRYRVRHLVLISRNPFT
mgnify:CR=1 FL=1